MIDKFTVSLFVCSYYLISNSIVCASEKKSIIPIPELHWNEIKDHTFLRLATPSGKIYHVTDNLTIVSETMEAMDMQTVPFLTVAQFGAKSHEVFIHFRNGRYNVIKNSEYARSEIVFELYSFTGVNKKRYFFNGANVYEAKITEDVTPADYLEFEVGYRGHDYAFTFLEDGSNLIDIVNCTNYNFLTVAQGNQHSHPDGSLPYITFVHPSGWTYDIFFQANSTGFHPFVSRDKSKPRNKCARDDRLLYFYGPDKVGYYFLGSNRLGSTRDKVDKIEVMTQGVLKRFLVSDNGELEPQTLQSVTSPPTETPQYDATVKPNEMVSIDLKCLTSCLG